MGFLHTVMISTTLKSHQHYFLSKPPNIMFTYISAYMVVDIDMDKMATEFYVSQYTP